jgi:GDP-L-fucose synthase
MILVTGATGFLGKHVCRRLKQSGRPFYRTSFSLGTDLRDFDQTVALFEAVRPTAVLNCATFVGGIQFGLKYPADIFCNNMPMIANLFEAAHRTGVERVVNPLGNCIYPAQFSLFEESRLWDGPLHESVMVYGLLRKVSWAGSWAYARQCGLQTINLVLSNMYGPEDHFDEERSHALGALVMKFSEAKKNGASEVIVWGTGAAVREWLFVEDGAEAVVRGIDCVQCTEPVNVGVAKGISIADLAERIRALVGYEGRIVYDRSMPDGAAHKTVDGSRGKALLGWSPQVGLAEGLRRTIEWYNKTRDLRRARERSKITTGFRSTVTRHCLP